MLMIFRPIIFFSTQINDPSYLYYLKYHVTKELVGKNTVCRGDNCLLCENKIPLKDVFLIPAICVHRDYIFVMVLHKHRNYVIKIHNILKTNLDKFKDNNIVMRPYFIDDSDFSIKKIDIFKLKFGSKTIEIKNKLESDFYNNYIKKRFADDDITFNSVLKKINNKMTYVAR